MPFVFGQVPLTVSLIEYAPLFHGQIHRMLETLEHQVTGLRPVAPKTQRSKRQGMGRVVGQIEAALQAEFRAVRILQPIQAGV